jgi:hypothetical protein
MGHTTDVRTLHDRSFVMLRFHAVPSFIADLDFGVVASFLVSGFGLFS